MFTLSQHYKEKVIPALMEEFGYKNPLAVPKLAKIVINVGLGEAVSNPAVIDRVIKQLAKITGQKGVPTKARRSIAGFKLRAGKAIGVKVTLRRQRMYDFFQKLVTLVLPRMRDFRGVSDKSVDEGGNCNLGFREQLVFPELSYDEIDKVRGLQVTIVTTAKNKKEGKRLLELLGMPFEKS